MADGLHDVQLHQPVRQEPQGPPRLQRLVSFGKGSAAKLTRARGVTPQTVENIRRRFVEEGMESALERKKPCRPSKERLLDGAKEANWSRCAARRRRRDDGSRSSGSSRTT